jgi:hypothetical protein
LLWCPDVAAFDWAGIYVASYADTDGDIGLKAKAFAAEFASRISGEALVVAERLTDSIYIDRWL